MDNLDPVLEDNQDPPAPVPAPPITNPTPEGQFSWKSKIGEDLSNSPSLKKFEDTPEGLKKAVESHISLEKLLGNEKVPIPKDEKDTEGWARFNKAMGVPDDPKGYKLDDPQLPESMKDLTFGKDQFAEVVHKYKLTPTQAKGLWQAYTEMSGKAYMNYSEQLKTKLNENANALKSEWGEAFASNVELGDMVINKFSEDKETGDFLTATLSKDPRGMKFLAKIGKQFSENKVGDFQYKRFSMTPDEAQKEITSILGNPDHPYTSSKASHKEHEAAVAYVNSLYAIKMKK